MILVAAALAREVDIKVHDMKGVVTGDVRVELSGPGADGVTFTCLDDGKAPDAQPGDRMYTAHAADFPLDHGTVTVRSGERSWQGGFRFDESSDPVLLIGLEEGGFAAASTKEVMFVQQDRMPPPQPGTPTGSAPPPPDQGDAMVRKAPARRGTPDGMWMGWGLAAVAFGGLGALAYAGGARRSRVPPLLGPALETSAEKGPYAPRSDRFDLFLGDAPEGSARIGEGRWTPEEVALAALRVRGPARIVVTDPARVDADGDPYVALTAALSGIADVLWIADAGGRNTL